jgi:predicted dinucleotide-binding enzyme
MKIGIVGSDDRAKAIGRLLRSGGHQLSFSDPQAKDRAKQTAATVGATQEIPYRQAMRSDILMITVPPPELDLALRAVGSGAETVVVDAVEPERGNGRLSGAEMLARKLDSHRIVRALINMPQSGANIPICGDDPIAKGLVEEAFRSSGCLTTDRGSLSHATELEAPRIAA